MLTHARMLVPAIAFVTVLGLMSGCRIGFDPVASAECEGAVISFEAETGLLIAPFAIGSDSAAFGGAYLFDGNTEGVTGPGSASFTVALVNPGTYFVWARTISVDTATDSFFVSLGDSPDELSTSDCIYSPAWHWAAVRTGVVCPTLAPLRGYVLAAGTHTLTLTSREGDSKVDRICIADDPQFVPVD